MIETLLGLSKLGNVSFVMHVVDSQNDIKDEDLVKDDNNNTLRVGN